MIFRYILLYVAIILFSATLGLSGAHAQVSPFIAHVYEFVPAPGQFTNVLPEYAEGDTEQDMVDKAAEQLVGSTSGIISLGAWGGYVTFGFDHSLVNVPDEYDLLVYGNAFISNAAQPQDTVLGSSEPGIVYVSRDDNGDGLPNDTWYEIAGSEADKACRTYEVTYRNAGKSHIPWTDNAGGSGLILRNAWHTQASYFPLWRSEEKSAVYQGTLLPANVYSDNNAYILPWGYVDNWPNDHEQSQINLDWAIDDEGQPADLPYVDFVRVMTGVMVSGSLIGEASTEVCGALDLHPDILRPDDEQGLAPLHATPPPATLLFLRGQVVILRDSKYYSILGYRL